jgi:hypothetical protein
MKQYTVVKLVPCPQKHGGLLDLELCRGCEHHEDEDIDSASWIQCGYSETKHFENAVKCYWCEHKDKIDEKGICQEAFKMVRRLMADRKCRYWKKSKNAKW